jgi:hypothetical protein
MYCEAHIGFPQFRECLDPNNEWCLKSSLHAGVVGLSMQPVLKKIF